MSDASGRTPRRIIVADLKPNVNNPQVAEPVHSLVPQKRPIYQMDGHGNNEDDELTPLTRRKDGDDRFQAQTSPTPCKRSRSISDEHGGRMMTKAADDVLLVTSNLEDETVTKIEGQIAVEAQAVSESLAVEAQPVDKSQNAFIEPDEVLPDIKVSSSLTNPKTPDSKKSICKIRRPKKSEVIPVNSKPLPSVSPETRRSSRPRAHPSDRYLDQAYVQKVVKLPKTPLHTQKPPNTPGSGRKMKATEDQLWAPENLFSKNSPFINMDLAEFINAEFLTRQNIGDVMYDELCALLPAEDLHFEPPSEGDLQALRTDDPKPTINPDVFKRPFFKQALRNYQEDLAEGKYEPEYLARAADARRRRMAGEFDRWKDEQFEMQWGDKQRHYDNLIAGESSKIRLQDLVKYKQFRVGDVFSMRRAFADRLFVRKDAVIDEIDLESGALNFSYPPGVAEWTHSDVPDKQTKGVLSLTALETLLLREDARAPHKLPNGNAFKTIRVIRGGEDMGSVFDLRNKFWHQYLMPLEEND